MPGDSSRSCAWGANKESGMSQQIIPAHAQKEKAAKPWYAHLHLCFNLSSSIWVTAPCHFPEQMKECAGQISHGRAGSMGAKLITRFVQQQRQAARSARLDKEEAALYRGPECDSAAIELPLPSIATEVIKSARTKDTMQKTSQRGNSESDPRGSKRTASTVEVSEARKLQKNGSRHMGNDYSFHRSERGNEQLPAGRGTCRGSAYVADLLQEIAADGSRGQDLKAQESLQHEVVGQAGKMRRQPRSMEGLNVVVQPQSDRLPAPDAIRKQVKTVSTERRVRQVLAEIR